MNQREKKMLTLLGVVAFLGVNMMLNSQYKAKKADLEKEKETLINDSNYKRAVLEESKEWENTYAWFTNHPVTATTKEDAQNALFNEVKATAERCKLIINPARPISFLAPVEGSPYDRVRISVDFTTTENDFVQWVTQINDPQKYRALTELKMEPTMDKKMVKVTGVVEQWVTPSTNTEVAGEKTEEGAKKDASSDKPEPDAKQDESPKTEETKENGVQPPDTGENAADDNETDDELDA